GALRDSGRERCRVEGARYGPIAAHALGGFQPQIARDKRLGLGDVEVIELELALAADLERVAEAGRRDEPGAGALALDQGVGEERRCVHDPREVAGGGAPRARYSPPPPPPPPPRPPRP